MSTDDFRILGHHSMVSDRSLVSTWIITNPGGRAFEAYAYCCRLFDRDELPYPSCSLEWHGKQPFWNRQGRRFVEDLATRGRSSMVVRALDAGDRYKGTEELTEYWVDRQPDRPADIRRRLRKLSERKVDAKKQRSDKND